MGPPAKRHLNGVSLAYRFWPNIECWLGSCDFSGGPDYYCSKNTIFLWFSRGPPPPLDPQSTLCLVKLKAGEWGHDNDRYFSHQRTVKPVLSGHSIINKTNLLKQMVAKWRSKVMQNALLSWSILQYFWPALSDNRSWNPILVFFLSGRLYCISRRVQRTSLKRQLDP